MDDAVCSELVQIVVYLRLFQGFGDILRRKSTYQQNSRYDMYKSFHTNYYARDGTAGSRLS